MVMAIRRAIALALAKQVLSQLSYSSCRDRRLGPLPGERSQYTPALSEPS